MSSERVEQLWIGEWLVQPALDQISRNGEIVKLEPRTMRLLLQLAAAPGEVLSSQTLLDHVWSGVIVGPASVYQAISQLRKVMSDAASEESCIATVPRKGYRLVAPVRRSNEEPASTAHPSAPLEESIPATAPLDAQPRSTYPWSMRVGAGVVAAVLIVTGLWVLRLQPQSPGPSASIAVLPFVDMTEGARDAAFCDGLTEELSTTLSQLPTLRVVARTSAFSFRGRDVDAREIGRQLSATHLLEGSVRRSGDTIRVTAKLVDTGQGYNSWSQSFDLPAQDLVKARDVLKMQSDIARSVAGVLEIRFPDAGWKRIAVRGTTDDEAYDLHLRARHFYRQRTPEGNARAIELNARAIDIDPKFALGHVGLAQAQLNEVAVSQRPVHEVAGEIERLLKRAVELDPELAEAYAVRGALRRDQNRLVEAREDLRRAVQLNRNNVDAIVSLGRVHEYEGLPLLALERFDQARALDPLDFMRHVDRCVALQDLARYDEADAACTEARALQPDSQWPYAISGWLSRAQGQVAESLRWNREALRRAPTNPDLYLQRFDDLLDMGMIDEARAVLQEARAIADDLTYVQLRYADILLIESGATAAREYLTRLDFQGEPTALDLLAGVQISLSADDPALAARLSARALSAPDYATVELSERVSTKAGTSPALPLAALDLRSGRAEAANKRLRSLAALLDRLERNGYSSWGIHSVRADMFALLGDQERAMQELRRAADRGWRSTWSALRDPYFAALRPRTDFQELIAHVDAMNLAERQRYAEQPTVAAQL